MFFQTGIDKGSFKEKRVNLLVFPLTRFYKKIYFSINSKKVYVYPSHRCFIRKLPEEITSLKEARKFIEEEYAYLKENAFWEIWWKGKQGKVIFVEFEGIKRDGILEPEPFCLLRAFLSQGLKEGELWDFGKSKITYIKIKNEDIDFMMVFLGEKALEEVRDFVNERVWESPVLLSGGMSRDEKVLYIFRDREVKRVKEVPPEEVSAFVGALYGIYARWLPSVFASSKYNETFLKRSIFLSSISLALLITSYLGIYFSSEHFIKKFKKEQIEIFQKTFPQTKAIAPILQTQSFIKSLKENKFFKKLADFLENLPSSAELLSLNYREERLVVKVQCKKGVCDDLPGKIISLKNLPDGTEILEIEF